MERRTRTAEFVSPKHPDKICDHIADSILDAYLSSSEEKIFGDFLEELALFVAKLKYGAQKSTASGIDIEFEKNKISYLISVKSGPNWGNSSQHRKQDEDFEKAVKVLKQSKQTMNVQPVLGICYGKAKGSFLRGYWKVEGQQFWQLISNSQSFYKDIVDPLGYKAKEHNDCFHLEKARIYNNFTKEFLGAFCVNGQINWNKLVEFNSGNL